MKQVLHNVHVQTEREGNDETETTRSRSVGGAGSRPVVSWVIFQSCRQCEQFPLRATRRLLSGLCYSERSYVRFFVRFVREGLHYVRPRTTSAVLPLKIYFNIALPRAHPPLISRR